MVPAINIVKPANVADVTLMPYFLEQVIQRVSFPIYAIVADKGYIDASIKEDARKELTLQLHNRPWVNRSPRLRMAVNRMF